MTWVPAPDESSVPASSHPQPYTVLVANYSGYITGDDAIFEALAAQLRRQFGANTRILALSAQPDRTALRYPTVTAVGYLYEFLDTAPGRHRVLAALAQADLLIIGGGDIVCGQRALTALALAARMLGIPFVLAGVGVLAPSGARAWRMLRWTLRCARLVAPRDPHSVQLATHVLRHQRIHLVSGECPADLKPSADLNLPADRETPAFRPGSGSFARLAAAFRPSSAHDRRAHHPGTAGRPSGDPDARRSSAHDRLAHPTQPCSRPGALCPGPPGNAHETTGAAPGPCGDVLERKTGRWLGAGRAWCGAEGGLKAAARRANDPLPGLKAGVSRSAGRFRSAGVSRSAGRVRSAGVSRSAGRVRSAGVSRSAGGARRVLLLPDLAVALPPLPHGSGRELLRRAGVPLERPLVAINLRAPDPGFYATTWGVADYETVARTCRHLIDDHGCDIVGIPLVTQAAGPPEGMGNEPDDALLIDLAARIGRPGRVHVLREDYRPAEVAAILAESWLALGMRLHFLLLCATGCVPPVALSYAPKVTAFMRGAGLEDLVVEMTNLQHAVLLDRIHAVAAQRDRYAAHLAAWHRQARQEVDVLGPELARIVRAHPVTPLRRSLARPWARLWLRIAAH